MRPYIVRQGEYLAQLAARFGFNAEEVWQHADNAELRNRRSSPEMLVAGDVLQLPEDVADSLTVAANTTNRYRGRVPTVPVEVQLELDGEPLGQCSCTLVGLPTETEAETDGEGVLRFDVPVNVDEVTVTIAERGASFCIRIGHLDPHDEPSGVLDRLVNLGYANDHQRVGSDEERAAHLGTALESFQRDHDLEPSGNLDDTTRDALRDQHGA